MYKNVLIILFALFLIFSSCKKEVYMSCGHKYEEDLGWIFYKPRRANIQTDTLYYQVNNTDTVFAIVESELDNYVGKQSFDAGNSSEVYGNNYFNLKYKDYTIRSEVEFNNPWVAINPGFKTYTILRYLENSNPNRLSWYSPDYDISDSDIDTSIIDGVFYKSVLKFENNCEASFAINKFYIARHKGPVLIELCNGLTFKQIFYE